GTGVTITAQLADANNNAVPTSGKTVTWSKTGAGGSFSSPTSITNGSGVAQVTFRSEKRRVGKDSMTGTENKSQTTLTATSASVSRGGGPGAKCIVSSARLSSVAGTGVTITAQLADANNNAVPTSGKTVTWSKTGAGGSFSSPTSITNGSGVAQVTF